MVAARGMGRRVRVPDQRVCGVERPARIPIDTGQEAFAQVIGQGATVAALIGVTALVAGSAPRWAGLAWVPFAASAVLTLLGPLLEAPSWLTRLSLFGHVHDLDHIAQTLTAASVLVTLGLLTAVLGLAKTCTRDLVGR
jgi:putative exporter of polyketide antibiotics